MDLSNETILRVAIHCCDNVKINTLLLQPALCMHVIDLNTGTYIKKSDRNRAVVSFYENQRDDVDYIMPVMTQSCTVSGKNMTMLSWEEDLILNEPYSTFMDRKSSIILFFEIVDLTTISQTKHHYERLNQNGMLKIAWGFLKLLGSNHVINIGSKMRLQLYKPSKPLKSNKASVVEVYKWWLSKSRIPMEASLYITVEPYTTFTTQPALRSMLPTQQEKGSTTFEKLSRSVKETNLPIAEGCESAATDASQKEVVWSRKIGEPCKIPRKKKLLLNIANCCQILTFSSLGRFLVAGCGNYDCYYLMFYQIPDGKLLRKILAHSELIYDLDWSFNDKYLLSSSGDYSVKMWNSKHWNLKETFVHPSYVYNAKFHPVTENLFASSCYDHIIRIWTTEKHQLLKELEAHNSTVCSLCWNSSGTKLYSADGIGQIKVWGKGRQTWNDTYQLENEIQPEETKGVSINKMVLDPKEGTLCLFCSDSVPRILNLENEKILYSYESDALLPKLSKGCCSPCGNLLFLCCDKGIVSVWNKTLGHKSINEILYYENYGAPSCIDYHPYEHMLALSFWDEGVAVHVYTYEETGQEKPVLTSDIISEQEVPKTKIHHQPAKSSSNKKDTFVKSCDKKPRHILEKEISEGSHIDLSSYTSNGMHGAAKYKAHNLDEASLTSSMDMYSKGSEDDGKESLTTVITKSGQFDAIADASDSNTFRSLTMDSMVSNKSSKRSQRRKKLRDMNKDLF